VLEGHTDEIFSCAFNYEGNTIITGKVKVKMKGQRCEPIADKSGGVRRFSF
jgi:dynein assembly factor with WDR repeat domains 1